MPHGIAEIAERIDAPAEDVAAYLGPAFTGFLRWLESDSHDIADLADSLGLVSTRAVPYVWERDTQAPTADGLGWDDICIALSERDMKAGEELLVPVAEIQAFATWVQSIADEVATPATMAGQ